MSHPAPSISVVIPTFDRAAFLREALESVLGQTAPCLEAIVVDDGSTDDTRGVVAAMSGPVRYLRQDHRGVASARNRGIREARGEWIAFLDSDDRWAPETLATLARAIREHPDVGLIAMRARVLGPDGALGSRIRGKKSPGPRFTTASLLGPDTAGVLTPLVRRSLLIEAGGFDETLGSAEDCDLWIRLSFRASLIGIPEPLLERRRHASNLTADRGQNARMWLAILDKLERDQPEFVRANRRVVRRARGKEHLRLGRALVSRSRDRPGGLAEARGHLLASIRAYPLFLRSYRTLIWSYLVALPRSLPSGRSGRSAP